VSQWIEISLGFHLVPVLDPKPDDKVFSRVLVGLNPINGAVLDNGGNKRPAHPVEINPLLGEDIDGLGAIFFQNRPCPDDIETAKVIVLDGREERPMVGKDGILAGLVRLAVPNIISVFPRGFLLFSGNGERFFVLGENPNRPAGGVRDVKSIVRRKSIGKGIDEMGRENDGAAIPVEDESF
jgi:hypothetical protein